MQLKRHRYVFALWGIAALSAAVITGAQALGYRVNFTASAPTGLWRTVPQAPGATVQRGMIVEVCPPDVGVVHAMIARGYLEQGDCPAGNMPLLKPVAAVPGDLVTIAPGQPVSVNGRELPNTTQAVTMPAYPAGSYKVTANSVWLFSSYEAGSFDSRYYGPVPVENIRSQVLPVLVRGNADELTHHAITTLEVQNGQ